MNHFSNVQRKTSYILKLIVIISAIVGVVLSAIAGKEVFMGGMYVFMYFTVQSNIVMALVCLYGLFYMIQSGFISDAWYTIKFVFTVSITLTGVVFCFVLVPTLGENAWNIQNVLTHVIVPVASVLDYFIVSINGNLKKRSTFLVIIPPILYAIYAGVGYVLNFQFGPGVNYPYFFLNWGSECGAFGFSDTLPFMGCAWWILALLVFLLIVGYIYIRIVHILKRNFHRI